MNQQTAEQIVKKALEKDELDKLLLATPEYQYLPKHSFSPWNTDLAQLLTVLYDSITLNNRDELRRILTEALIEIVQKYEGIIPVALCILFESIQKSSGAGLGLPLDELSETLHAKILIYKEHLFADKSGSGGQWSDGLLGELRKLSKNTNDLGGPQFWK